MLRVFGRVMSAAVAAALAVPVAAHATENGGSAYPHGAEGWTTGFLPPPGTYLLNYTNYYTADRLNDANGDKAIPDFHVRAYADTARFVHVTGLHLLGGTYAVQMLVPLVHLDVKAMGASDHRTSVGDIVVDPFILGWHFGDLHIAAGLDMILPTGGYDKNRLANIGRNYFTLEPAVAFTYLNPNGAEVDAKFMYDHSTRNHATRYQSGDELHVDFAAGWNLNPKWGVGVSGYWDKQVSDDYAEGLLTGNRGEALALGPTVKRNIGHTQLSISYQHEFEAYNRPQGEKLWVKWVAPLGR